MALLQNEDFAIWYLRTSYLANAKDGIGDRLVNVNSSILNTPGFRAAGWTTEPVQRTYSPPIPTTISSKYIQNGVGINREPSFGEDEDEGGMVTGRTSNDTVGPGPNSRRKRRKEQIEEDDSSELSDESDDGLDGAQRAAQQIRFAKMPTRDRADSSPIRNLNIRDRPEVTISSPSKPNTYGRHRTGSLGAVEAVKARARRDTTTSSDLSSENEIDSSHLRHRQIHMSRPPKNNVLTHALREEADRSASLMQQDDSDAESVGSALSSDLGETIESPSLPSTIEASNLRASSPSTTDMTIIPMESPKKVRTIPILQDLPPPRPISVMKPQSLLSAALRAEKKIPQDPIKMFAALSGQGSQNPLWIKIYLPFSTQSARPLEIALERTSKDGNPVIVAEAIGFSLWRYSEEDRQPTLKEDLHNVNKWTLRMVEDGEVDFDFPALARVKLMTDFTSNNNRGVRGRSRERPFDEFALVEATTQQEEINNRETPQFIPSPSADETVKSQGQDTTSTNAPLPLPLASKAPFTRSNVLLAGQPFASALSNTGLMPADRPAPADARHATPRLGVTKTVRVRFFDVDISARTTTLEISTDSYIAEILDHVCKRWNFDKAGFLLKVTGTNTIAPLDRTVEALGNRSDLDLVRKRFGPGPVNLTGSPGSSSPNAPLLLDIQGPKKGKKNPGILHPLAQQQDIMSSASNFKKYYVTRKQLASFTQGSQRMLVFDGDYMHVMPADTSRTLFDSNAKSSSIAFSEILRCKVSSKHNKLVRVVVRRPNESKRYDFEARTTGEASEIVEDITREMHRAKT